MIFNTDSSTKCLNINLEAVQPSKYPLGYEGALMHVYENECNYNAIMKAVGLSEMSYYQETGRELFLNEAGAFSGFIDKVKAFFKKVIEKIESIFKKFIAIFRQYTMEDSKFVKEYSTQVLRKDISNFEFEGYKFGDINKISTTIGTNVGKTADAATPDSPLANLQTAYNKYDDGSTNTNAWYNNPTTSVEPYKDTDAKNKVCEKNRGLILGDNKEYDEEEFKDELIDKIYGTNKEKETLDDKDINMRDQLNYISNTNKDIKDANKLKKDLVKSIDKLAKEFDKLPKTINTDYKSNPASDKFGSVVVGRSGENKITYSGANSDANKTKAEKRINDAIKYASDQYDIAKTLSNDVTIAFGIIVQAYKDRNRQARAMCVKVLSHKESAMYESTYNNDYDSNDIFSGVSIK